MFCEHKSILGFSYVNTFDRLMVLSTLSLPIRSNGILTPYCWSEYLQNGKNIKSKIGFFTRKCQRDFLFVQREPLGKLQRDNSILQRWVKTLPDLGDVQEGIRSCLAKTWKLILQVLFWTLPTNPKKVKREIYGQRIRQGNTKRTVVGLDRMAFMSHADTCHGLLLKLELGAGLRTSTVYLSLSP